MAVVEQDWAVEESKRGENARDTGVAIVGGGLITALGYSAEQTWEKLLAGESICDHSIVNKRWGGRSRVVGLAIDAARQALGQAGWNQHDLQSAGLVVGTSKGAIVDWIDGAACGNGVGEVTCNVAEELKLQSGPRLTVSAACASGLLALIRGVLMIKAGEARRVLVVAAEASVHEMFISSFRRLGVLSPAGKPCRPFDQSRGGFLMSEAGAAICLQGADGGDAGDLLIEKMAMAGDATHLIGGDDGGGALRTILSDVINDQPLDLIHAHGTGTVANDAMELRVIEDCVAATGGLRPALYSHKGALGHSLGAAGLVSVVINRMIHKNGIVPPGLGEQLMNSRIVELNPGASSRSVKRSIATAAGFGGAMGAVSLRSR